MLLIFTMGAFAQNASMQKTAKAVFTLTTFNKDGSLKASSHGIFVSADGQAVSTWAPFSGADHAIVIDAEGKQHKVETIIGANFVKDFFARITDVFGGRSGSYERVLREGKEAALAELTKEAQRLGANAVVGLKLDYEAVGASGSMLMVVASGTAVVV